MQLVQSSLYVVSKLTSTTTKCKITQATEPLHFKEIWYVGLLNPTKELYKTKTKKNSKLYEKGSPKTLRRHFKNGHKFYIKGHHDQGRI